MGFLNVVLFLQVPNKSYLKSVDALNVSKNHFQLVIIKHVHPLSALPQVALWREVALKNLILITVKKEDRKRYKPPDIIKAMQYLTYVF